MNTFFENPMFFFMDEMEPILPTFRSPDYNDSGRIVELADVGCDTDTTFPVYFSRAAFDCRRRGTGSASLTRKTAKWRNEKPRNLARIPASLNNDKMSDRKRVWDSTESTLGTSFDRLQDRNKNYITGKMRRDEHNYDHAYIADLDYDAYTKDNYEDYELPTNDSTGYTDNYYTKFIRLQNRIGRSRKKRDMQYDYSSDLKSPSSRDTYYKQNPRWFNDNNEKNFCEAHNTDARSRRSPLNECRKHINISPRMDKDFHRKSGINQLRSMKNYQREDAYLDVSNSTEILQNGFWEFIPFENGEPNNEELMYSGHADIADSEKEEKPAKVPKSNSRDNLSPEIENTKHRILKKDTEMKKFKIVRPNLSNVSSPRARSAKTSTNDRSSNICSAEKDSIDNVRPHLTVEEKKTVSLISADRKEKSANSISARTNTSYQYHDRFVNKSFNKSSSETNRPMKIFKHIVDSKSNEQTLLANKKHNANPHSENFENNSTDRINVSRSMAEEITKNKNTLILKMTKTSSWIEIEKEKKFSSKLPVRTWKRLRTKEPAALRPENNATNEDVNQEIQRMDTQTTHQNDHSMNPENDENREEIVADHASTRDCNNIKRSYRFRTKLINTGKSELTSTNMRKNQKIKDSGNARRAK